MNDKFCICLKCDRAPAVDIFLERCANCEIDDTVEGAIVNEEQKAEGL